MNWMKRLLPALALLLAACGAADTATQPSPEVTDAPVVVATAIPTVQDNSNADKSGAIVMALTRFNAVSAYRAEMEMVGTGALGLTAEEEGEEADQEVTLFNVAGDFAGADGSYVIKGFLSSLLGVNPVQGLQAMIIGGKGYVKGPIELLGAMEDKWYVLDPDQSMAIAPPLLPSEFLTALGNSSFNPADFTKSASESLDGRTCDVYQASPEEAVKALGALKEGVLPGIDDMATITKSEATFAVCDDGYLHRVRLMMEIVDNADSKLVSTFLITIRMRDFNAAVTLTAPPNAVPLAP